MPLTTPIFPTPCHLVDDGGDGWLSLFQLFGGNRATPTTIHHHTTTITPNSKAPPPHITISPTTVAVRPPRRTTATSLIVYRKRPHCTRVEYAGRRSVIGGIMRQYIGPNRICVRCVGSRLRGGITWRRTFGWNMGRLWGRCWGMRDSMWSTCEDGGGSVSRGRFIMRLVDYKAKIN